MLVGYGKVAATAAQDRPGARCHPLVDAYPPVEVGDSASMARLAAGWNAWLDKNRGTGELHDQVLAEVAINAPAPGLTRSRGRRTGG